MTAPAPWDTKVPQPVAPEPPRVDPDALALEKMLATFIQMGSTLDARSRQAEIGSSEVGWPCDRRVVYKLNGTPESNRGDDPLRRLIGTGGHKVLADVFRDLDGGRGIFMVEQPVVYRGVPGTADLAWLDTVIDWKFTSVEKIKRLKREGPPRNYLVQLNMYAAGLRAAGYDITTVALCFVPIDADHKSGLRGMWVSRQPFNQALADDAVDRLERLRGLRPSQVDPKPDRLCAYCAHYNPNSTDLDLGCLGPEGTTKGNS
jgi:hypothetical protein